MYALFEDSRQVPRRPRHVRGRVLGADRARYRQARQGQGRQRAAALRAAGAGRADRARRRAWPRRSTSTSPGNSRPTPTSASPTWRATTSRRAPAPRSRPRRCSGCSRRRTTSAAWARATSARRRKRSSRRRCSASSARSSRRRRSMPGPRELAAGQLPGADPRAALQDPVQARTRTRPSTRRWSRPRSRSQRAPLDLLGAAGAIDSARTSSTGGASCSSSSRTARGFPGRWPCRRSKETLPLRRRAGLLDRRFGAPPRSTTRCRCRAWAAAASCSASTSPRPGWRSQPGSPLDQIARDRLSTVYMPGHKLTMLPDEVVQAYTLHGGARDCPAVSLYVTVRRGDARDHGARDAARARVDRQQPAPRPARRRRHRGLAAGAGASRATPMPPSCAFALRLARAPEGAARSGARQARDLQPARLHLPAGRTWSGDEPRGDETVAISRAGAARRWT